MRAVHALWKLGILACCGILLGCPHRYPLPADALKTPESVLASVAARVQAVKSLVVDARVSAYTEGKARKGHLEIALKRPASLVFAVLSPTGDMLSVLASDGKRFTSFERGGKVCVRGCSTPDNIARLIPLALKGTDAVAVLLGVVPVLAAETLTFSWSETEGTYVVTVKGAGKDVQRLWVEHGTGLVRRSMILRGARKVMELTYEHAERVGGVWLPHRLRVKMDQGKTDLQLDYRDVEVNPATLTEDTFQLACPAGTNVKDLGCKEAIR